ncbi:DUF1254 domain-containing protein [Bradyrhizobium japonicum]|jgi:hypothetical protein|uniref:DUF1254 domain-containing protein n=1 Tax=Bradyrhizobium japonicum TaxID=375 RepID=UPI0020A1CA78|nr:DUF1214 domain-containing protein [Bradyrhizobium japonicum]MCP1760136.1 hypothetical protein [Bradyrhizobium japonicum]MCP1791728.1 hypothetical protein [Bradyrhizobium japonicum]MCP1804149.1 hypothetical protein [Bradyrhizobium japonicum]MCP1813171.1 hypothetical protein [Bradyrhizobium japonicum]MCP1875408.1 hypothetical protein [Bradyrhizobium japonicum]
MMTRLALATFALAATLATPAFPQEPLGGQPAPGTKQSVSNLEAQVAYQRAFEATLWAMPAVAIYRFRVGLLAQPGMADNVIAAYHGPLHTFHEAITPNQVTPYIAGATDLRNGPVVLQVPAKTPKAVLYGQVVDAWQATVADVGPVGADKGEGGKYLFVPPGYSDRTPEGYFVIRSSSYRLLFAFRSIALGGASAADAYAYSKTLKMYPLSEAANPPSTRFVDDRADPLHTLPFYDIRALKDIYDIVTVEPVQPRDKVMMGMLATIGIEPGKPFNPPEKYKAELEKGIVDAYYYMQKLDTKLFASSLYWPDRHWSFVMVPDAQHGFNFVSDNAVEIDKRAAAWFFFTFYPKVLSDKAGTVYLAPIADSNGRPLEAGKTYKLRVPKEMPAREFWSLTMYDRATWAFVNNPLDRAGLGSFNKDQMKMNPDGSVDLYVGPNAPPGQETNWIPTMDKEPYLWLRLYGPQDAFWTKTFKMPDVELVN